MPYHLSDLAGKPYTPSNGTEGAGFIKAWCDNCRKDDNEDCPILAASFIGQVPEWVHDAEGQPTCTAFQAYPTEAELAAERRKELEAAGQQRLPEA